MNHNYFEFVNKVIIVTGGANGIGAACVQAFAQLGANVFSLDLIVKENDTPYSIIYLKCDISNQGEMSNCINKIINDFGRIDCLVNNAGYHPPSTTIDKFPPDQFNSLINLNLTSAYTMSYLVYEQMKKTGGTIINISSMAGVLGQENSVAYCASKAGLIGLTKSLAIEAAGYGIRVNCVSPSNVMTNAMTNWLKTVQNPEEMKKKMEEVQVLNRMATPDEIANTVVFLASTKSSFITGVNLKVDGGASLDY